MTKYSALLVCSGGGHLKQLSLLAPRMGIDVNTALWVTFDTGLSTSLLAGCDVRYATYAAPRDLRNIARNQALAREIMWEHEFGLAASTGASLAVNFLPLAVRTGVPSHYIESAARAEGPSMTGRIIRWAPGVKVYSQYPSWAGGAWGYAGSVFDGFSASRKRDGERLSSIRSAVVSLGTTESYGFRRLLETASRALAGVPNVLWQTGATPTQGLGIDGRPSVPAVELEAAIRDADVVVTHAGTGIALTCLEAGKVPVLVPRRRAHGEHVDDHQLQIASELAGRGLAVTCDASELDADLMSAAMVMAVERVAPPPLSLTTTR